MGLLSPSVSIIRYRVNGKLEAPVLETIGSGLKSYAFTEMEDEAAEKTVGWTTFEKPYVPDFERSSFTLGTYFVFSLRIDKKSVPSRVLKKHYQLELDRQLAAGGREYLSRSEKMRIKDEISHTLLTKIPSTPNVYDLLWNYEESALWFFSTLKSANEELETLFAQSFRLTLIRLFPYTMAELASELSDTERDMLKNLTPSRFTE